MENTIHQVTLELWKAGRRIRRAPSGWLYGNAACCHHRGQRMDKRGRGGVLIDGDSAVTNCFNCGFKAVYKIGEPLSERFRLFLKWLGADENLIGTLVLEALRSTESYIPADQDPIITPEVCELPAGSELISENPSKYPKHIEYLKSRGIALNSYAFLATQEDIPEANRIIIPFIKYGKIVGYTARLIYESKTLTRYIMRVTRPYVFGSDLQKFEWQWTILTEGPFDALSLDGLSIFHNTCSSQQAQIINNLGKRIIVVPDFDTAGLRNSGLIQDALNHKWSVSIPEWPLKIKDVNSAILEYGPLAVTRMILDNVMDNPAKIQLKARFKLNET